MIKFAIFKIPIMKKILIFISFFFIFIHLHGATTPAAMKYLDGYFNNDSNAAVTVVMGKALNSYDLDEYRGLTLTYTAENADKIEEAVKTDANTAIDKEIAYRKGKLYYAFITLPPEKGGKNRYLFYLNQTLAKGNKLILIYMRGKASAEKIKKMIKK